MLQHERSCIGFTENINSLTTKLSKNKKTKQNSAIQWFYIRQRWLRLITVREKGSKLWEGIENILVSHYSQEKLSGIPCPFPCSHSKCIKPAMTESTQYQLQSYVAHAKSYQTPQCISYYPSLSQIGSSSLSTVHCSAVTLFLNKQALAIFHLFCIPLSEQIV